MTSTRAAGSALRLKYQPGWDAPPSFAAATIMASPSRKNWSTTVRCLPDRRPRVVSRRASTFQGPVIRPFVRR